MEVTDRSIDREVRARLSKSLLNVPLAYGVWGQCPYFVDFVLFYLLEIRDER